MHAQHIKFQEYGPHNSINQVAHVLGISSSKLKNLLETCSLRIESQLRIKESIKVSSDSFQFQNIAGLLRLSSQIEIEVCPKFLNPISSDWKSDFFQIASITSFSKIFPEMELMGGHQTDILFANLLARIFISQFRKLAARPIRTYQKLNFKSFEVIGELDWESIYFPDQEGFKQDIIQYTGENEYNRIIYNAVLFLLDVVTEQNLKRELLLIKYHLSPQRKKTKNQIKTVPSRHKHWNELYKLSFKLNSTIGLTFFGEEHNLMPGFIIKSDKAWEELLKKAFHFAFPGNIGYSAYDWGTRQIDSNHKSTIKVHPDISLINEADKVEIIIDAKYKGRSFESLSINRNDIYEVFSFLKATSSNIGVLLYPGNEYTSNKVGETVIFEEYEIEDINIFGAEVSITGISSINGFYKFSQGLKFLIETLLTKSESVIQRF